MTGGADHDGPSDEEASSDSRKHTPLPPSPPGPSPPKNSSPGNRSRSNRNYLWDEGGGNFPLYPTTTEVVGPRSRMVRLSKQNAHADHSHGISYGSEPSAHGVGDEGTGAVVSIKSRASPANHECFPAPSCSPNESRPVNFADNSRGKNLFPDHHLPSSCPKKKLSRGQVLVHDHSQLGDEGYESTLISPPDARYSRVSLEMDAAASNSTVGYVPLKHMYSTSRGMHTRMIDDLRDEEINHSPSDTRWQLGGGDGHGYNNEYNNAATRQIRRRVFRVALERGMHDERRRKLLDADMDVGGPSLRENTEQRQETNQPSGDAIISLLGLKSPGDGGNCMAKGYQHLAGKPMNSMSDNEGDMPISPRSAHITPCLPYSDKVKEGEESSVEELKDIRSPSSLLPHPPSDRTIVQNLIAQNEPEKLSQIDRVMEKYAGREEELIKKLDLRYRRRRARREMILEDLRSTECSRGSKDTNEAHSIEQTDIGTISGIGSKPSIVEIEKTKDQPLSAREMEDMTSPAKITFIKLENNINAHMPNGKDQNAIVATQRWNSSDRSGCRRLDNHGDHVELQMPPQITKKLSAHEMDGLTSPEKMNSIKLDNVCMSDKGRSVIMAMQSWDSRDISSVVKLDDGSGDDDNLRMPPKITKEPLPTAISDSTRAVSDSARTDIHFNAGMGSLGEDDDKLGYIGIPNVPKADTTSSVENLGNQVMKERILRGNQTVQAAISPKNKNHTGQLEDAIRYQLDSPSVGDDYKLKTTYSYGDGISVITMETKSTLEKKRLHHMRADGCKENVGEMNSFDEALKRPPNSITVEDNSGSFENNKVSAGSGIGSGNESGKEYGRKFHMIKQVVPEVETREEKARAVKVSQQTWAKLADVEARIQAHYHFREEEKAVKEGSRKKGGPALIWANDELYDVESMFHLGRKGKRELKNKTMMMKADDSEVRRGRSNEVKGREGSEIKTMDIKNEHKDEEVGRPVSPMMIESILSSFDEADQDMFWGSKLKQPKHPRESQLKKKESNTEEEVMEELDVINAQYDASRGDDNNTISTVGSRHSIAEKAIAAATRAELQRQREVAHLQRQRDMRSINASGVGDSEELEEEIARLIAERESRFRAEKAVALMRARRELETERRARYEAEAARIRAEEELERLKSAGLHVKSLPHLTRTSGKDVPLEDQAESMGQVQTAKSEAMGTVGSPLKRLKSRKVMKERVVQERLKRLIPEKMAWEEDVVEWSKAHPGGGTMNEEDLVAKESQARALAAEPTPTSTDHNSRVEAEFTRLKAEQELERLKLEKTAQEAEAAKVKVEEELEQLKLEMATIETESARIRAENDVERMREVTGEASRVRSASSDSEASHRARLEAEAARHEAERELERLKLARMAVAGAEDEKEVTGQKLKNELKQKNSDQDRLEIFRNCYTSDEDNDNHEIVDEDIQKELSEKIEATSDVDFNNDGLLKRRAQQIESLKTAKDRNDAMGQLSTLPQSPEHEDDDQSHKVYQKVRKGEHDFASATMVHSPKISPGSELAVSAFVTDGRAGNEEDGEAQIYHVARAVFEGDGLRGQLSFTIGSRVEAHPFQRGSWWLGRCGGQTGWFPSSAVVPASEFLSNVVNSPSVHISDRVEMEAKFSGEKLDGVYDLIRSPSDPIEQNGGDEFDDSDGSLAKNCWLDDTGTTHNLARPLHDRSPLPFRSDPSEMAGLSDRLYDSHDNDSLSNQNEVVASRSPPLVSHSGIIARNGKLAGDQAFRHIGEDGAETLCKDVSSSEPQLWSAKIAATDAPIASRLTVSSKESETKDSKAKATGGKPMPTPGWRATKDPKSGLMYYFHTETRETMWKKPPDFVPRKASARIMTVNAAVHASKDTLGGGGARGIMGFLSKIKKVSKAEVDMAVPVEKSPRVPKEVKDFMKDTEVAGKVFLCDVKPQTQAVGRMEKIPESKPGMKQLKSTTAETESLQKDSWTTLDDFASIDESERSEMTEGTNDGSLFSKRMIKTAVGKWAGAIAGRLNSPPNHPYDTLNDSRERWPPPNTLEFSTNMVQLQEKSLHSAALDDGPHANENESEQLTEVEGPVGKMDGAQASGPVEVDELQATELESHAEFNSKSSSEVQSSDASGTDYAANIEPEIEAYKKTHEERSQMAIDKTAAAGQNILSRNESRIKIHSPTAKASTVREKTQWRSAIDATTGRTYYYIKGTQKVTWEKPTDM